MRIAVLDNDPDQAKAICEVLASAGHAAQTIPNGKAFLDHISRESIAMLVMHWHLPDQQALDVLRTVRSILPPTLPILLIVERTNEDDIAAALNAGADDYQLKPLRRAELALRVKTLLKRAYPEHQAETEQFGNYAFEPASNQLRLAGGPIDLTQKEFTLALLFFRNLGRPLSRAYIQEKIWPSETDIPSRTLDTHVSRVRNKLGLKPENGFKLSPVYSYGYRLEQLA